MRKLLLLDYLRGTDSTGLAAIGKDYDWKIAKIASHPIDLFDSFKFKAALSATTSRAFIGHNRAATRGAVNGANAHPFEYKHIVGAHNGTLDQASWNRLEDAVGEKFGTDSNAIFAAIAKLGVVETIGLMEEGATSQAGAWALVWYDGIQNTINFLRNQHRPLWLGTIARGDKIFWASEWEMIDYATTTSSTDYKFYFDKDKHCFFPLPVNEWHSYDLEELAKAVDGPIQPKIVEVKGRAPVAKADPFGRDVDEWDANRMGFRAYTSTTNSSTTHSRGSKNYVDCLNIEGDAQSPFAGFVSKADFDMFSRGGCAWCKAPVKFTDIGLTIYERESHVVCAECSVSSANRVFIENKVFDNLI